MRLQSAPFIRLGTRGSALALAQAQEVRRLLAAAHGVDEADITLETISTTGDRVTDRPLSEIGGKGLFSREIEAALAAGTIDVGVHSAKDLSTVPPEGMALPVFLEREDVRDAFVSLVAPNLEALPQGARLGTSSIRRAAQMLRQRPDLEIVGFRGNVGTRLDKLARGVADATLLAVAGLKRTGQTDRIASYLDPRIFLPAPGQGAIGLEIRADDRRSAEVIAPLDHQPTHIAVSGERAMLGVLDGSCRTPVGAFTELNENQCTLHAEILSPDGSQVFRSSLSGSPGDAVRLGGELGQTLLDLAGPDFVALFRG